MSLKLTSIIISTTSTHLLSQDVQTAAYLFSPMFTTSYEKRVWPPAQSNTLCDLVCDCTEVQTYYDVISPNRPIEVTAISGVTKECFVAATTDVICIICQQLFFFFKYYLIIWKEESLLPTLVKAVVFQEHTKREIVYMASLVFVCCQTCF